MNNNSHQTITGLRYSRDNWFTCVDTVVMLDEELYAEAKYLFAVLCAIAGFGHRSCVPDNETIAGLMDVPEGMLKPLYDNLEARGVIMRDDEGVIHLIGHNAPCYSEEEYDDE